MIALAGLFTVILLTLVITRVATVALVQTGLSRETARFQARSALSGVGFTTSEAESVVSHPVRRRIVMLLMLLGGAGIVSVVGALFLSFAGTDPDQKANRVAVLLGGLVAVWLIARSRWLDRQLSRVIGRVLQRWSSLPAGDYAALLHLSGDWRVAELAVDSDDWVAGRSLGDARLRDEGVIVLGITRADGAYIGAPGFDTEIRARDTLLVYGRSARIEELDGRKAGAAGDQQHAAAAAEHHELVVG